MGWHNVDPPTHKSHGNYMGEGLCLHSLTTLYQHMHAVICNWEYNILSLLDAYQQFILNFCGCLVIMMQIYYYV